MQKSLLMAFSAVFVAAAAWFAPDRAWVEFVSQAFVPYGAVPLVAGFLFRRHGVAGAATAGAGANMVLLWAFYFVRPLFDPSYAMLWGDLGEWTLIGVPVGAVLGTVGWWLAPRVVRNPIGWGLGTWGAFAVFQVLNVAMLGIGRTAVTTSSGIVTVGFSALDAVVGSAVVSVFCGLLILGARPPRAPTSMVRSAD